jgi:hypothetical protein
MSIPLGSISHPNIHGTFLRHQSYSYILSGAAFAAHTRITIFLLSVCAPLWCIVYCLCSEYTLLLLSLSSWRSDIKGLLCPQTRNNPAAAAEKYEHAIRGQRN